MERTTICIEKPLLAKIKSRAHRDKTSLKNTIRTLIIEGLSHVETGQKSVPKLPSLSLGQEMIDVADRSQLYEMFERRG